MKYNSNHYINQNLITLITGLVGLWFYDFKELNNEIIYYLLLTLSIVAILSAIVTTVFYTVDYIKKKQKSKGR